ncbi:hypothetical protein M0811_04400 [Anaeramoeba ignava]|uniref:Uncharacterized protein n=1 Tax=Anaeramoeba ignava TaxID=1746090 RepID=A0A9Q0RI33_ANAIG|nr:hypothetical protein M0811_04400 [Anaeramoeba ignava]
MLFKFFELNYLFTTLILILLLINPIKSLEGICKIQKEFRIGDNTTQSQRYPKIFELQQDTLGMFWIGYDSDNKTWEIYNQLYAINGTALNSEKKITINGSLDVTKFEATQLPSGEIVLVWEAVLSRSPYTYEPFLIDAIDNGNFAVLYADISGSINQTYAQTFDNTCQSTVAPANLFDITLYDVDSLKIASGHDGILYFGYTINSTANTGGIKIWVQRALSDLSGIGNPEYAGNAISCFQMDLFYWGNSLVFRVGKYISNSSIDFEIVQYFPWAHLTVQTSISPMVYNPRFANFTEDSFVLIYENYYADGSANGIFGIVCYKNFSFTLRYDQFPVNTYTESNQDSPDLLVIDNQILVVWESLGQTGNPFDYSIYYQLLEPRNVTCNTPTLSNYTLKMNESSSYQIPNDLCVYVNPDSINFTISVNGNTSLPDNYSFNSSTNTLEFTIDTILASDLVSIKFELLECNFSQTIMPNLEFYVNFYAEINQFNSSIPEQDILIYSPISYKLPTDFFTFFDNKLLNYSALLNGSPDFPDNIYFNSTDNSLISGGFSEPNFFNFTIIASENIFGNSKNISINFNITAPETSENQESSTSNFVLNFSFILILFEFVFSF